jgi:hypothetical protein
MSLFESSTRIRIHIEDLGDHANYRTRGRALRSE